MIRSTFVIDLIAMIFGMLPLAFAILYQDYPFALADLFLKRDQKWLLTPITVGGLALVGVACWEVWGVNETVFAGFYRVDDLSVFFKVATVVIGILSALFAPSYLRTRRLPLGEFNVILLFSLTGMFVLASSSDLITLVQNLANSLSSSHSASTFAAAASCPRDLKNAAAPRAPTNIAKDSLNGA